jgi:hypothetical protein
MTSVLYQAAFADFSLCRLQYLAGHCHYKNVTVCVERHSSASLSDALNAFCSAVFCLMQVRAACRFVRETGKPAGIGALQDAARIAKGETGTLLVAGQ